jgi:hypothetical protein
MLLNTICFSLCIDFKRKDSGELTMFTSKTIATIRKAEKHLRRAIATLDRIEADHKAYLKQTHSKQYHIKQKAA